MNPLVKWRFFIVALLVWFAPSVHMPSVLHLPRVLHLGPPLALSLILLIVLNGLSFFFSSEETVMADGTIAKKFTLPLRDIVGIAFGILAFISVAQGYPAIRVVRIVGCSLGVKGLC